MNNEEKILEILEAMQQRLVSLESDVDFVRGTVTRIEQDHGKKLDALFDGYQQVSEKVDRIEEHVSAQDEVILRRVFPKAMEK